MESSRQPFVSVVIPVRNEHKYIRACLDSVLRQDYPRDRHEVLLAVGPSEDDTEEIIRERSSLSYLEPHLFLQGRLKMPLPRWIRG